VARNNALLDSLGIGAPASKTVPATNSRSSKSTRRAKGKTVTGPAEIARETNGASRSDTDEDPTVGRYISKDPRDNFGRVNCVEGESSGSTRSATKIQIATKRPKTGTGGEGVCSVQQQSAALRRLIFTVAEGGSSGQ
jgi:hypothetical protein